MNPLEAMNAPETVCESGEVDELEDMDMVWDG